MRSVFALLFLQFSQAIFVTISFFFEFLLFLFGLLFWACSQALIVFIRHRNERRFRGSLPRSPSRASRLLDGWYRFWNRPVIIVSRRHLIAVVLVIIGGGHLLPRSWRPQFEFFFSQCSREGHLSGYSYSIHDSSLDHICVGWRIPAPVGLGNLLTTGTSWRIRARWLLQALLRAFDREGDG